MTLRPIEEVADAIKANIPNTQNITDWWEFDRKTKEILTARDAEWDEELQKAREEERERIEAVFKEHVPPHAMDLEDSVWLKRLLNKAFNHDKNV